MNLRMKLLPTLILFFFCGIGDLLWHLAFGIEKNIDAELSPTHMGIVISSDCKDRTTSRQIICSAWWSAISNSCAF